MTFKLLIKVLFLYWSFVNLSNKTYYQLLQIIFLPSQLPTHDLQIMVCSCAMLSNCVWLQIIFCSCVNDTALFSFLRSLLRENGRSHRFQKIFLKKQTRRSNDKTIIQRWCVFFPVVKPLDNNPNRIDLFQKHFHSLLLIGYFEVAQGTDMWDESYS